MVMGLPSPRGLYDKVERLVSPIATQVIGTEDFANVVSVVTAAKKSVRNEANKLAAGAWHALNLPAGTDVQRLKQQVGSLDREIRLLSLELQQARRQAIASPKEVGRRGTSGSEHH